LEFILKVRQLSPSADPPSPSLSSKKTIKKFFDDVQKGNVDKVKEKVLKGFDPNVLSESLGNPFSFLIIDFIIPSISILRLLFYFFSISSPS